MILTIDSLEAPNYDVIDLNTGIRIPHVQYANDKSGEVHLFLTDSETNDLVYDKQKQEYVLFKFKGNIKFIKKGGK